MPTFINFNSISGVSTVSVDTSISIGSGIGITAKGITGVESINSGPLAGTRNRIINGDMRIDQRNAGASVTPTDGQYVLDRWKQLQSVASKYSVQRNAGSVTPPTGFTNYLGVTSLSAYSVASGNYFCIMQEIEGFNSSDLAWGTANAVSITLSFWVRSSLTGTFGGAFGNSANNRGYPFTYIINAANTWEQKSITIAGDTTGTWETGNGAGVRVKFGLGVGSTYSGTAGSWQASDLISANGSTSVVGTNGATFYLTGVQLEAGTVATPFERRSYGQELALCRRYYKKGLVVNGNGNSAFFWSYFGGSLGVREYDIDMPSFRTAPNLSLLNNSNVQYYSYGGAYTNSTLSISTLGQSGWPNTTLYVYATSDGDGRGKLFRTTNATDVQWVADAEL